MNGARASRCGWQWRQQVCRFTVGVALLLLSGCKLDPSYPVSGKNGDDPTWSGTQSETASAMGPLLFTHTLVVTYNDDTQDSKVQYTSSDRIVFPGASMLGWSYSTDNGVNWTYGGKVRPPPGWDVLWGDPAIVSSSDTIFGKVYISTLAGKDGGIPATGHHGGLGVGTLNGACVARSDDGGVHFAIQSCVSNQGHFYDGSALAIGAGSDPRLFAAYNDVQLSKIDVWVSPDGMSDFVQLPDPFPGKSIVSHPRLAYDRSTGALLVAGIENGTQFIFMSRWLGNAWQTPVKVSNPVSRIDIAVAGQTIRMASGYSFDIGAPSVTFDEKGQPRVGDDAIRLMYTTRDAQTKRIYVRGTACRADLSVCKDVPQWGTTPGNLDTPRDQWNPTVTAWDGRYFTDPVWKATYETTDDDPNGISIMKGNLGVLPDGTPIFLPIPLVPPRSICPEYRDGSPGKAAAGYWGDYNEKVIGGLTAEGPNSLRPLFLLSYADSSKGCTNQSRYTSTHLHVSSVVFQ